MFLSRLFESEWVVWFILLLFINALILGWLTRLVAESKGYDSTDWFLIGFLFTWAGLLAAIGIKPSYSEDAKKCPKCKGHINPTASICKYCGSLFSDDELIQYLINDEKCLFEKRNEKEIIDLLFRDSSFSIEDKLNYIFNTYRSQETHVRDFKLELLEALYQSGISEKYDLIKHIAINVARGELKGILLKKYHGIVK